MLISRMETNFIPTSWDFRTYFVKSKEVCGEVLRLLNIDYVRIFDYTERKGRIECAKFINSRKEVVARWHGDLDGYSSCSGMLYVRDLTAEKIEYFNEEDKLFRAVDEGKIRKIQQVVKSGIDINTRDTHQYTPLMRAIRPTKCDRLIKCLIKLGADIDAKNVGGDTVLSLACHWGYYDIVEILLEAGADPNIVNNRGMSALKSASRFVRNVNKDLANLLVFYGAIVPEDV